MPKSLTRTGRLAMVVRGPGLSIASAAPVTFRFLRCPEMRLYRTYQQLSLSCAVGPWSAAVVGVLL